MQLQSGDLAEVVEAILQDTGFTVSLLELEATDNILLDNEEQRATFSARLSIAFDGFGTGYASLSYLKKILLDRLKIDKSFVGELQVDSDDAAIVGSTTALTKLLGPIGHRRRH